MEGLFSYMTESDKEMELISMLTESRLNHISLEINKLLFEHAENISALELKVMMESGSSEDLEYFYAKEAEEVKEKSKGLITRLFEAILNFIKAIKNKLFGVKIEEEKLPDEVKLDKDPDKIIEEGNKVSNAIKNLLSNHKLELGILAGAAVATGVVLNKDKIAGTIDKLKKFISGQEKQLESMEQQSKNANLKPEELSGLQKGMATIRKIINDAKDSIATLLKAATGDQDAKDELADKKLEKQQAKDAKNQQKREEREDQLRANKDNADIAASAAREVAGNISNTIAQLKQRKDEFVKQKDEQLASIKKEVVKVNGTKYKGAAILNELARLKKSGSNKELNNFRDAISTNSKVNNVLSELDRISKSINNIDAKINVENQKLSGRQAKVDKAERRAENAKAAVNRI